MTRFSHFMFTQKQVQIPKNSKKVSRQYIQMYTNGYIYGSREIRRKAHWHIWSHGNSPQTIRYRQFDTDNSTPTFVAENIISIIIIVCIIILNVLDV